MYHPSRNLRKQHGIKLAYNFGGGYAFFPITIFLAVNSICNLRCKMCDIGQRKKDTSFYKNMKADEDQLTIDEWKKFIDSILAWRPNIDIVGTEPLLYADLIDLLRYLGEKQIVFHVTTNGTMLEKVAKELAETSISGLFVSLDGHEELHDEVRGVKGTFRRAVKGIEAFRAATKRAKGRPVPVHVTTTICPINHDQLYRTAQALLQLDVDSITMNHFSFLPEELVEKCHETYGDRFVVEASSLAGVDLHDVDIERLWSEVKSVEELAQKAHIPLRISPGFTKEELRSWYEEPLRPLRPHGYCNVPWMCAGINARGDVINIFRCPYPSFGNIRKQPFAEIWNNRHYVTFRRTLKRGRFIFCTRCRRSFNTTM